MLTVYRLRNKNGFFRFRKTTGHMTILAGPDIILAPLHHYTIKTTFLDFYLLQILPLQKKFNLAFYIFVSKTGRYNEDTLLQEHESTYIICRVI